MRKTIVILSIAAMVCACSGNVPEVALAVRCCAPMPVPRASASACVLEGKAYIFGGRTANGTYLNDLWQYDPATDQWTDMGNAPMNKRVKATMIAADGRIYVGLGYSAQRAYRDTAYQQDWWSYRPDTQTWTRLADYPDRNTVATTPYLYGDTIYVLYGNGRFFTREVGVYAISSDQWTMIPYNPDQAKPCFGACGTQYEGMAYFGTGFDAYNLTQWYRADLPKDRWMKLRSIPGKGRQWCACTASKSHIYLFGGRYFAGDLTGGEIYDTYMRYAPEKGEWEWCGTMPCGRAENQIAFSIDGVPYFGLGEDENGKIIDQLYYIEP